MEILTSQAVVEYLDKLKKCERTELTLYSYKLILVRLSKDYPILNCINSDDLDEWLLRNYEGKKSSTINNCASILKNFFTFCMSEKYIKKVPLMSYWFRRLNRPLPKSLSDLEIAKLQNLSQSYDLRDRTIIALLEETGIRRIELSRIDISDIDLIKRAIKITGKGNRKRTVNFDERCCIILEKYLGDLGNISSNSPLLLNNRGTRLSVKSISNIVSKTLGQVVSSKKPKGCHILRHTWAYKNYLRSNDLVWVQSMLGHKFISTTEIYTVPTSEEKLKIFDKYMG